ncbi:Ger(x)C family spore germination protein [Clostridium botulinum]|uniref:Spore gernimation protein KC n=1 Tax=Clostridium botulinum C/D str. DC5 TaxID=1443128 RepID=A0A0A0IM39_CLOBO|nr:Ger(x)C family spore germination protein [Clostridium botulinum]KGN01237.1 spore gernimation protein KC [Clostridium botulinum C/D str. DC5]KOC53980.1 spore gernimation protein KC [Clostridium botulinum]KOC57849.1 spore gernimation protein KC [Clostridium botulinum]MCD3232877.1 Ger(x)C family spore germination protein [Clostridium botulinum D/C]MCD3238737.1 Ger(x)C family spore germination protein [Clostridium botulinum D/C]
MKKYLKAFIAFILIGCISLPLIGCWDYSEMTDLEYVAGIALDKDRNTKEYILTIEVLEASVSSKSIKSSILQTKGKTIHQAFRNAIKNSGKKLQLSHAKILILSRELATEGITPVIDFINRDVEARNDMWVLISSMSSASQILIKSKTSDEIISYDLADAIKNCKEIGLYIPIEVFRLIDDIENDCIAAMVPTVRVTRQQTKSYIEIDGMCILKSSKCIGHLSGEETSILQLMKGRKGRKAKYVLTFEPEKSQKVTLEIMRATKKIKPRFENNNIYMDVFINMDVALSELAERGIDFVSKDNREELIKKCEKDIENRCCDVLKKLQYQYGTDVVGFGCSVNRSNPKLWKKIKYKWNDVYKNIKTNVYVKINIKYSGLTNKNIKLGE